MSDNTVGRNENNLSPEELVEIAERRAGSQALDQVVEKHLNQVMEIREKFPLNDLDLVTVKISQNKTLPEAIRNEVGNLRGKLRALIEEVARRIEERKYKSSEVAIQELKLSYTERERVNALINADKNVHISYQSLKIAVESFSEFNKLIIKRLEESEMAGNVQAERNLVLGNALLVYELTDFVITYVQGFKVKGVEEISQLHNDMLNKIKHLRQEQEELKQKAQSDEIDLPVREQILANIQARESSIEILTSEWDSYVKTIKELESDVDLVRKKLPTLSLIRDNAKSQINFLEAMAVMQIVKDSLDTLAKTIGTLEKIELVSLSPDRVRRLLGIR